MASGAKLFVLQFVRKEQTMGEIVTLEIPENVARNAREIAKRTQRPMEEVLIDWIDKAATELPVESLSDEQILALCDSQLEDEQQAELSQLLAQNREGKLSEAEVAELDDLMQLYRRALVRKALAWKVAVVRGLRPSLESVF
jgi:hypothetical protein